MNRPLTRSLLFLLLSFFFHQANSQSRGYIENKGQWNDDIIAQFQLANGTAWIMNDRVRFPLIEESTNHEAEEFAHDHPGEDLWVEGHCYEMIFGTEDRKDIAFSGRHSDYVNYFIGKDRKKWASRVGIFDVLELNDVRSGIDLQWSMEEGRMKYTFRVEPNVDPSDLFVAYQATRGMRLEQGSLIISLPNMDVEELAPYVYQLIDGKEVEVTSSFRLEKNRVYFNLGAYDSSHELFIDPVVVASTNIGSAVNTYGHSATFDQFGNILGGGRPFGQGYPSDSGSFQMNFAGGGTDIGISKLNVDGSDLIWSTYIGGATGGEYVHSIVVNGFNQTIVLGKTVSSDYPVSLNAFDTTYNGGQDICLTILSDSGDSVVGSTYVGGALNDGENVISSSYAGFKGEVVCDLYSNVYVASTSSSENFPVTANAYQMQLDSLQDGVVFKMNFNLSQMIFSTYLGTDRNDAAFNLKPADDNTVYVCGATAGDDFPVSNNAHDQTWNYGNHDAFITRFNPTGESIINSTYVLSDSNGDDKAFFLQLDRFGDVYIMGSSNVITADTNKYAGPGTGSFIRKYSPSLDSLYWTSTFANVSHSAFLVDNCRNIYAAGNSPGSVDTINAVQSTTGGFYVMVLAPEADSIIMGSYYGAGGSHVDGGTSRFDKRGAVYQATCTAGYFPLTGNAWSGNMNGGVYDLTVFKIDMEVDAAVANAQVAPNSVGCVPFTVDFTNYGSNGLSHYWDFKDGDTSHLQTPTHTFTQPGTYEVEYVIYDTIGCVLSDTATLVVIVYDTAEIEIIVGPIECVQSVQLSTNAAFANYLWSTGAQTQTITIDTAGSYWLQMENICGSYSDTVQVSFTEAFLFELIEDTGICDPAFLLEGPASAVNYNWNTGDTTQNLSIPSTGLYILIADDGICSDTDSVFINVSYTNFTRRDTVICFDSAIFTVTNENGPITWSTGDTTSSIVVDTSGLYWVLLENGYCTVLDSINVTLAPLVVELPKDTAICTPLLIDVSEPSFVSYLWSDGSLDSTLTVIDPGIVWLEVNNGFCSDRDSMLINLIQYIPNTDPLQHYCDTLNAFLTAGGLPGANYLWSNGETSRNIFATQSGRYFVTITQGACLWKDTFEIQFSTSPEIEIADVEMCRGDKYRIPIDTSYASYLWSTSEQSKTIVVEDSGKYWVSVNNAGCETMEEFHVSYFDATKIVSQYIPNIITPNADGLNDAFIIDIRDYTVYTDWDLWVYNRWGSLVYHSSEPKIRWEGRAYGGEPLESGVYYFLIEGTTMCLDKENVSYRGSIQVMD